VPSGGGLALGGVGMGLQVLECHEMSASDGRRYRVPVSRPVSRRTALGGRRPPRHVEGRRLTGQARAADGARRVRRERQTALAGEATAADGTRRRTGLGGRGARRESRAGARRAR